MQVRFTTTFILQIRSNHSKEITPWIPYSSSRSTGDEWRKKIIPNHEDYTGIVAQIISEFDDEGTKKYFLSSGSIQVMDGVK